VAEGRAYWLEAQHWQCEIPDAERRLIMTTNRLEQQHPGVPVMGLVRGNVNIDRMTAQHLRVGQTVGTPINGNGHAGRWGMKVVEVNIGGGRGATNTRTELGRIISAEFEGGRMLLPEHAPGLDEWIAEHKAFDHGLHDDWVETTLVAGWHLFQRGPAPPRQREPILAYGALPHDRQESTIRQRRRPA
jgi:hypothetical protein